MHSPFLLLSERVKRTLYLQRVTIHTPTKYIARYELTMSSYDWHDDLSSEIPTLVWSAHTLEQQQINMQESRDNRDCAMCHQLLVHVVWVTGSYTRHIATVKYLSRCAETVCRPQSCIMNSQ